MQLYRVTLRLTAPLGSPLVAPMIFGQLCWIVAETEGSEAMDAWLNPERIWKLSDALPKDWLPKPLTRPRTIDVTQISEAKQRKKAGFVSRRAWLNNRSAWDENHVSLEDMAAWPLANVKRAHNTIDRIRGTVIEAGGLYFVNEDWRFSFDCKRLKKGIEPQQEPHTRRFENSPYVDLYIETSDEADRIRRLLTALGQAGFGRDASTGRGCFAVVEITCDDELKRLDGSNRMMSLSRGVLTPETMHDALWRVEPHFGRAGPQISQTGHSPFKRPVLLTRPGATYRSEGVAGRWVTGLHTERQEIGLNGLHLSIPFKEAPDVSV